MNQNQRKEQDPRKKLLCDLIRNLIRSKGWLQKDAAEKAGLHETAMSNICWRNAERYTLRWLVNVCYRLEIPMTNINNALRENNAPRES